jgi:actin-like ATPase involved in cell morphogenesis
LTDALQVRIFYGNVGLRQHGAWGVGSAARRRAPSQAAEPTQVSSITVAGWGSAARVSSPSLRGRLSQGASYAFLVRIKEDAMLLGIDYGTTRTVVATVDRGNYPVVSFHTAAGDTQDWYPSLITACGAVRLYGLDAARHQDDADWVLLRSFKRQLATLGPAAPLALSTGSVTALELLTAFLTQLRRDLVTRSNLHLTPQEPLEAVIAVPANANSNQRFLTLEAFRRAGFQVRGLLNEPSAAGIEYAHHTRSAGPSARRELVVVYDLGGGTFDASVISMAARRHEVVRSAGIAQLGGDDVDTLLLDLACEQAGLRDWTAAEQARLLEECREKKEGLHPNTRRLAIDLARGREGAGVVVVSTSAFYERCQPLVECTLATLEEAMQGLDWGTVAALYVVGGASALPVVGRLLRERYGRKVRTSPYPHAATAIGLAIAADQEAGYQLQERFTRHFGVWREAEDGRAVTFDVVFAKDSVLPAPGEAPLTCIRRYQPTHNIGHFRYLECSQLTDTGDPTGDLTPWDEVYFPFVPALHTAANLQAISITRLQRETPWIEERYTCEAHGIIAVEMQNQTCHYTRRYHLRGTASRAPLQGR